MWIVYSVSSYSYSAAVWFVGFFWADVAAYSCVCDIFFAICWYLVLFDEKESVSPLYSSWDSLCKSSNFVAKGLSPRVFVFVVFYELFVLMSEVVLYRLKRSSYQLCAQLTRCCLRLFSLCKFVLLCFTTADFVLIIR